MMCNIMRWLIALVCCCLAATSFADNYSVVMECEVKYQTVVGSAEGKPEIYTGFTGQVEAGDTVTLEYGTSQDIDLYMKLTDTKRNDVVLTFDTQASILDNPFLDAEVRVLDLAKPFIAFDKKDGFMNFSTEEFNVNYFSIRMHLDRYYKSDFHGLFVHTNAGNMQVFVQALDCRMVKDEFDQVLSKFEAKLDSD